MSKKSNTGWSEKDLLSRGYVPNKNGGYDPPPIKSKFIISLKSKQKVADDDNSLISDAITIPKQPLIKSKDFILNKPTESFLTIHGIVAGLNGPEGLMRGHWTKIKKQKELYCTIIRQQLSEGKVRKHEGSVKIRYIGYKSHFMDWDNFCASFKHIGDSLVHERIIRNDNPTIITKFLPEQIKCKKIDQKVIIIIEDVQI